MKLSEDSICMIDKPQIFFEYAAKPQVIFVITYCFADKIKITNKIKSQDQIHK